MRKISKSRFLVRADCKSVFKIHIIPCKITNSCCISIATMLYYLQVEIGIRWHQKILGRRNLNDSIARSTVFPRTMISWFCSESNSLPSSLSSMIITRHNPKPSKSFPVPLMNSGSSSLQRMPGSPSLRSRKTRTAATAASHPPPISSTSPNRLPSTRVDHLPPRKRPEARKGTKAPL